MLESMLLSRVPYNSGALQIAAASVRGAGKRHVCRRGVVKIVPIWGVSLYPRRLASALQRLRVIKNPFRGGNTDFPYLSCFSEYGGVFATLRAIA